jgi:hypothetical protein
MRKCPFCEKKVVFAMPQLVHLPQFGKWTFMHHCNDDISVFIIKDTKEEIITEWNGSEEVE